MDLIFQFSTRGRCCGSHCPVRKYQCNQLRRWSQPHFYSFTHTFFQNGSLPAFPAQSAAAKQLVLRRPCLLSQAMPFLVGGEYNQTLLSHRGVTPQGGLRALHPQTRGCANYACMFGGHFRAWLMSHTESRSWGEKKKRKKFKDAFLVFLVQQHSFAFYSPFAAFFHIETLLVFLW